ncbi:signal peptide peptidase SppA [Xylanimonas sp. McL0601]|uniref:signal peptide peptidase SppA n=1 Tax=Xylanimonas sp. McL0601 TaxID=3414739 RepID=UPI003CE8711F
MVDLPGRRTTKILLEVDLTRVPADPDPDDPLGRLRARGQHQLRPILRALHEAADDPRVVGLVARVGGRLPWPAMQELRIGVAAFTKPKIAWAETFGEGSGDMAGYVLATAFDEIWLQPGGELGLLGVAAETTFLRGVLDKLGLEPQLEQRYEYKNAADRITRTEFTDAHREAADRLVASIYDEAIATIATARETDEARVRELVDTGPRTAVEAHEAGLVDQLGYRDQVYAAAKRKVGHEVELLFADRWKPRRRPSLPVKHKDHVALVRVHGTIVTGRSRRGPMGEQVGSDSVCAALRAAMADEHAGAVVLHVDSPGGSAVASDTIWREAVRVREAGKTLVVSMGALAASGGYYISCPADVIVALPATLTGSIGVFGGKIVISDLLERIGAGTGTVAHGARSLMYSPRRRFEEQEHERLSASVDAIYTDFVAKVAEGRGRSVDEISSIARGRVWTGTDARRNGLVDELGGLRDAVRIARSRAGLPDSAPVRYAAHVPPLDRLRRPRNSEDPRALAAQVGLPDVASVLGLPGSAALRMPPIRPR